MESRSRSYSRGVRGLSKVMTPRAVKVRAAASSSESILYVWNNTNAMEISLPGSSHELFLSLIVALICCYTLYGGAAL
ncbi:unnamed protein product [Lasius platythorax]|uniref:Uncharacterized protein n=1 Tax=Lasius platythorax TaxID=488582 RepID=A0AAV2NSZ5_9HYME